MATKKKTKKRLPKVKPCPFCGEAPEVLPARAGFSAMVACYNDNCSVQPETYDNADVEEAIRHWNTCKGDKP